MGIQSTILLTRRECVERIVAYLLQDQEQVIAQGMTPLTNEELEDWLEKLHDNPFDNFRITDPN